jgi:hypothetical protein
MTPIDNHHDRAAQLSRRADFFARVGRMTQALAIYREELAEDEAALSLLKAEQVQTQSLFVVLKSAASLALECIDWPRGLKLIEEGVGAIGTLMQDEL